MVALRAVEQALGWLPGIFELVLGAEATALAEAAPADGAGDDDGDCEDPRELTADSTIDWA